METLIKTVTYAIGFFGWNIENKSSETLDIPEIIITGQNDKVIVENASLIHMMEEKKISSENKTFINFEGGHSKELGHKEMDSVKDKIEYYLKEIEGEDRTVEVDENDLFWDN